jgi:beta-mannosidase
MNIFLEFRGYILILFFLFFSNTGNSQSVESGKTYLTWKVGFNKEGNALPNEWYASTVPGAVQLDVAKAKKYAPYYYANNFKDYSWMEDQYWTYQTKFKAPPVKEGERIFFISKGIDYKFKILLNGSQIFSQEGMFTPVSIDLTDQLKGDNELLITIYPTPKSVAFPVDRSQANASCKPAVSYGWDWHPRLIPLGIWDDTYLEVRNQSHLTDVNNEYNLNGDLTSAFISFQVEGKNLDKKKYRWQLIDQQNKVVLKKENSISGSSFSLIDTLKNVSLWWTYDHGSPVLYKSVVELLNDKNEVVDKSESNVGFRQIKLLMNDGAWIEPINFPKSRSVAPMSLELNGRKIFCKGTNWVNPEIFPGIMTAQTYQVLLDKVQEANFNLLRVWGGGIVNKNSFFEICDKKGILVWQEFPLACNLYEGTPHYLSILKQESASIIKKVKDHPSLAIWCGGNELFNNWSGMTDQSLPLRLLDAQCYTLDPKTPFLMTSPLMGVGHGHYLFRDPDSKEEVFSWMPKAHNTAYCEFGMPGPSSVEALKTFIPPDQLFPPKLNTVWETHHAYNSWVKDSWLCEDMLTEYFGKASNLEELVANGQLVQCAGYKAIYEEARRQKPYCSMALNWCFNEPWPTAANNSLVEWPAKPKPAFYAVSKSCRPVLASARIPKFRWKEGEEFSCDLWMLNDSPNVVNGGQVIAKLVSDSEVIILNWDFQSLDVNKNLSGPTARFTIPSWKSKTFKLVLEVKGRPELNSEYVLLYSPEIKKQTVTTPELNR